MWVKEPSSVILYARISSKKQQTSLERQEELLKAKYPEGEFISDVASGFNQNRRGYKRILERAIDGTPLHIVATSEEAIICIVGQILKDVKSIKITIALEVLDNA